MFHKKYIQKENGSIIAYAAMFGLVQSGACKYFGHSNNVPTMPVFAL